jgi:uncharacterized protein (DUF927 family)
MHENSAHARTCFIDQIFNYGQKIKWYKHLKRVFRITLK